MRVDEDIFGHLEDGTAVKRFTLRNEHGTVARVTEYGAILTELHIPDRHQRFDQVVLGFDNLTQYRQPHPHFGGTIGRVANRIAHAAFSLDGQYYPLTANHGPHHLHGGEVGFDRILWQTQRAEPTEEGGLVELSYLSRDGEEGYPGDLSVTVGYVLTENDELKIRYTAHATKPTPLNPTNHTYFNLAATGDVLGHEVWIHADSYTPTDHDLIPTGEIKPVRGTPLDLTQPVAIGKHLDQLQPHTGGYDHNYCLNHRGRSFGIAARVYEPNSGRLMEVYTTEPGIQLYTGNNLDGSLRGFDHRRYDRYSGLCLETQHFPDAVHHPHFPSIILRPQEAYQSTTIFNFSAQ